MKEDGGKESGGVEVLIQLQDRGMERAANETQMNTSISSLSDWLLLEGGRERGRVLSILRNL